MKSVNWSVQYLLSPDFLNKFLRLIKKKHNRNNLKVSIFINID